MSSWAVIVKLAVKTFWPWFVKFAWPFIKEQIMEILNFMVRKVVEMAKERFAEKASKRRQEAQQKAKEAESKAGCTTNDAEAEKYRAVAQVWHEIAEQYRRDNEDLKGKLEEIETKAEKISKEKVGKMDINLDFKKENSVLKLGESTRELPRLPWKKVDSSQKDAPDQKAVR